MNKLLIRNAVKIPDEDLAAIMKLGIGHSSACKRIGDAGCITFCPVRREWERVARDTSRLLRKPDTPGHKFGFGASQDMFQQKLDDVEVIVAKLPPADRSALEDLLDKVNDDYGKLQAVRGRIESMVGALKLAHEYREIMSKAGVAIPRGYSKSVGNLVGRLDEALEYVMPLIDKLDMEE